MKTTLLLVVVTIFCFVSNAQENNSYQKNLTKYWNYRKNLKDNFMVVGIGKGQSLPASIYNPKLICKHGSECYKNNGIGLLNFGDATINLGEYIAVLVTEYVLLNKNNLPTETTLEELYYAMLTIDRLDILAETTSNFELSENNLNGFLLRDDVDDELLPLLKNKNICVKSDYKCLPKGKGNFMSHDQLLGIYLGLVCIAELLDESTKYNNYYFKSKAKIIADRLIQYPKSNSWDLKIAGTNKNVGRGHEIKWAAFPFTKMASRITGKNYADLWSSTIAKAVWKFGQYPFITGHNITYYNPAKDGPDELVYNDVNSALMLRMAVLSDGWKPKKLAANAIDAYMELNILQDVILNKNTNYLPAAFFECMLDDAPKNGLQFYMDEENISEQWNSTDRWGHPRFRKTGTRHGGQQGHYVGLDYMMLFNFYCLAYPQQGNYTKNEP